jgi:hypothetical protein
MRRYPLVEALAFGWLFGVTGLFFMSSGQTPRKRAAHIAGIGRIAWHVKHVHGGYGELRVEASQAVSYSEPIDASPDFTIPCADFLAGSGDADGSDGSDVHIRTPRGDYWLKPVALGPSGSIMRGSDSLYKGVTDACVAYEVRSGASNKSSVVYDVVHWGKSSESREPGKLGVLGSQVSYSGPKSTGQDFNTPCVDFLAQVEVRHLDLGISVAGVYHSFRTKELRVEGVYRGISEACAVDEEVKRAEKAASWAKAEADAAEGAAALEREFEDSLRRLWSAAAESDPFASVRGDFDLASPTPAWKTKLSLVYADRCILVKSAQPQNSAPAWTFACKFNGANQRATYEYIVQKVQSALNLKYQPDEAAVNVNQVFFGDSAKPAWKLVVTKVNPSFVVLWITPTQLPAAMPFGQPSQSSDVTIHDEVEKIRRGSYSPMPAAQRSPAAVPSGAAGRTTMTVRNSTQHSLSVYFDGPVSRSLILAPGSSQTLDLAPGAFHVAGRVDASNVLPFYGDDTYQGSVAYTLNFYIGR